YKKPNLRRLYFILFPACIGIEITSGFDSRYEYAIEANLKGFLGAIYSLGAIISLPFFLVAIYIIARILLGFGIPFYIVVTLRNDRFLPRYLTPPTLSARFLPESLRYLISKDRYDNAFDILTKYHAEGDRSSVIVKAELAARRVKTVLVGYIPHGRYTSSTIYLRFSRPIHVVVRYYLSDLLNIVGITDGVTKSKINIGIAY
ncbi:hypothetical protein N7467_001859, partial [Penicillium canescens]